MFLTENDGSSIIQFMGVIQSASAALAASKADKKELEPLRQSMELMCSEQKDRSFFDEDMHFHHILAELSGNPLFVKSMEITSTLMERYFAEMVTIHGRSSSIEHHRQCLDAVERGDAAAASQAMTEHYKMLEARLIKALADKSKDTDTQS